MEEKRFFIFLILTSVLIFLMPQLVQLIWPAPPRPPAAPQAAPEQKPAAPAEDETGEKAERPETAPAEQAVAAANRAEAPAEPAAETGAIGSTDPASGFKMELVWTNRGASIRSIQLAEFRAEERTGPLELIGSDRGEPGSFALELADVPARLGERNWTVVSVADEQGAESVRFETTVPERGLAIAKTFHLTKDSYAVNLTVEITQASGKADTVSYRLGGPRGFVVEGVWYANKLRDVAIGGPQKNDIKRQTVRPIELVMAADTWLREFQKIAGPCGEVTKARWLEDPDRNEEWFVRFDRDGDKKLSPDEWRAAAKYLAGEPKKWAASPLRFAGVEGQYFMNLMLLPSDSEQGRGSVAVPVLLERDSEYPNRSDVSVEVQSPLLDVQPGSPVRHEYAIYAGPRSAEYVQTVVSDERTVHAILAYGMFSRISRIMVGILRFFHGWVHNWGVAIILLTVLVRMCMFPISRRQAIAAQKMQQKMALLKPELDKLREKHKNNPQEFGRAQLELWRKHGMNPLSPMAGCLPVLLQMPIFIGLWQGLQSAVELRQSPFVLWIDNLSAPDMLFPLPLDKLPLVGGYLGPYFNLLPILVVGLMILQQKLFTPPATDPQMESQQKMMSYMMVLFAVFFYKFPSGLCLYIIASTSWALMERKLVPKMQHATEPPPSEEKGKRGGGGRGGGGRPGRDGKGPRPSSDNGSKWTDKLNELIKRASKR